jgi:hypothetical protein
LFYIYFLQKAASLSKELHEQGSAVAEVDLPSKKGKGKAASKQDDKDDQYEDDQYEDDQYEDDQYEEEYESEEQQDYNSEIESETEGSKQVYFATMPQKKASIASPLGSSMKKRAQPKKLAAITGAIGAPIANGIAAPII